MGRCDGGEALWGGGEDQRARIKCETLMAALSWGNWALRENEGKKSVLIISYESKISLAKEIF